MFYSGDGKLIQEYSVLKAVIGEACGKWVYESNLL